MISDAMYDRMGWLAYGLALLYGFMYNPVYFVLLVEVGLWVYIVLKVMKRRERDSNPHDR